MKHWTKSEIQRMILKELRWQGKWLIKSAGRQDIGIRDDIMKEIEKLEKRLRKLEKKK